MPIDERTFGVEFECYLPEGTSRQEAARAISRRIGKPCHAEEYGHEGRAYWKIITDGSLGDFSRGIEVVSPSLPPLSGPEGLKEMAAVAETLSDIGCTVTKKTGTHVHIGCADQGRNLDFFKRLVRLYQSYEPVIDAMMPPSRRAGNASYCRSICGAQPSQVQVAQSLSQLSHTLYLSSGASAERYLKLNLTSFAKYKTVEFRQHSGTIDQRKIKIWVSLCLKMVEAAINPALTFEAPAAAPRNRARPGSKRHTIVEMILRPNGATRTEIVSATNWPSVSIAQIAASNGLDIISERTGREVRYRLNAAATAHIERPITIEGFCAAIGASDTEREYITERTANLSGSIQWAA